MFNTKINHDRCECYVGYCAFKGRDERTPGLWCVNHGTLFKWLSWKDYDNLVLMGVEDRGLQVTKQQRKLSRQTTKI